MSDQPAGEQTTITVRSTSRSSAVVEDIVLPPTGASAESMTRRILRPLLVNNVHDEKARVKITLMHQRRVSRREPWKDADSFNLATLKAGQEIKLALDASQTLWLYRTLQQLYAVTEGGIPQGERRLVVAPEGSVVVVPGRVREVVDAYLSSDPDAFWAAINDMQPDLLKAVAITKLHESRRRAVDDFRLHLDSGRWKEGDWQQFFENNTWIFGQGLAYQFLGVVQAQPSYGGTTVRGTGGQRGDFLAAAAAAVRFTALVDIKTPAAELVSDKLYRNKVHVMGHDLVGGVAQLQSNCRTWTVEGSRQEENREDLEAGRIYTYEPKGILVIGHTSQLAKDRNKRATFELFRRNLHNPEVITFDELLEKAEFVVAHDEDDRT